MHTLKENTKQPSRLNTTLNRALPAVMAVLMSSTALACNKASDQDLDRIEEARDRLDESQRKLEEADKSLHEAEVDMRRSQRREAMLYMQMNPQQAMEMLRDAKKNYRAALDSGVKEQVEIARIDLLQARTACEYAKSGYFTRNGKYPRLSCR